MWPTVWSARRSLIGATQRTGAMSGKEKAGLHQYEGGYVLHNLDQEKHIRKEFYGEPVDNGNIEKAGKIIGTGSDSQKLILLFLRSH